MFFVKGIPDLTPRTRQFAPGSIVGDIPMVTSITPHHGLIRGIPVPVAIDLHTKGCDKPGA